MPDIATMPLAASRRAIRLATPEDIPTLVRMGERFHAAVYAKFMPFNADKIAYTVAHLLDQPGGAVFVASVYDVLVGTIGMWAFEHPISGEKVASEVFWWSEDGRSGLRLYHHGEQWAREQGATMFQMTAPNQRVADFYGRLGLVQIETVHQKELR